MARSRSVSATLSRISARLPPTSRWMFTARTAQRKSGLPTRIASASRASSVGRPSLISETTRWNSVAAGCGISRATVSSACMKLWPARRELAMIVSTSGSCSRSFSVRLRSDVRRAIVGPRPQAAPTTSASSPARSRAAPTTAPTTNAMTDRTTNSPDRTLTPADSSSASRRSLNPRDSAKRFPKLDTRSGIQPCDPSGGTPTGWETPATLPTAAMRAAISRSFFAREAVPSSSQPRANTAPPTSAARTTWAPGVLQNDAAITGPPSARGRTCRRRGTRRARRACRGTSAEGPWTSADP